MAKTKEKTIAVCRSHWTKFVPEGIVVLILLFVLVAIALPEKIPVGPKLLICAVLLLAAVCAVLHGVIEYRTTYLELTPTSVIGHKGFIRSKSLTAPLSRVQDTTLANGLWGKIFRYHTIVVTTAGSGGLELPFKRMAKAKAFAERVNLEMEKDE